MKERGIQVPVLVLSLASYVILDKSLPLSELRFSRHKMKGLT